MNTRKQSQKPLEIEKFDDDFFDYIQELEKQWKQSQPRFSDKELLAIYPAIIDEIPQKLVDLNEDRESLVREIRQSIVEIRRLKTDAWFAWEFLKNSRLVSGFMKLEYEISRFQRLKRLAEGKPTKGRITEDQLQEALNVPLFDIASQHTRLRKSGRNFSGLCPLHEERTASFFIFSETNSFYCFGCNKGGDVIVLVRNLYSYSFKEAVKYLIGG